MRAILLVLRSGPQWNELDATGICSSSSAQRRFPEWTRAGVFECLWREELDGAMTKAPSGGAATGPDPTARAKRGRSARSLPALRASP
jgi:transposase